MAFFAILHGGLLDLPVVHMPLLRVFFNLPFFCVSFLDSLVLVRFCCFKNNLIFLISESTTSGVASK